MSQTNGIKIEVDVELKNKNFFKGFEKPLDNLLNKFNKISKQIDIINKKQFKLNTNKVMQMSAAVPKAKITKPPIIEATTTSNKANTKKSKGHLENIKSTLGIIDSFKSDSLSNAIKPLNNIFELKDKITTTFNGMKDKFNEIKDKAKELKSALVDATHTDGKFDLGKTIKFGAVTAGLLLVSSLYNDFTNHLATNEEAQKKWNEILTIGQEILALLGEVVFEFISTLLGFNKTTDDSKNKGQLFNIILDKLKETAEKLKEKVQELREWVDKNKEAIGLWGDRIKTTLPYIIGLFVIFKLISIVNSLSKSIQGVNASLTALSLNPVTATIAIIVIAIILLVMYFKHLYETNETFRAGVDKAWNAIKEVLSVVWAKICEVFQGILDFFVKLWTENEELRLAFEAVWNAVCSLFDTVSQTIGTILGVLIGWLVDFYTKNEVVKSIISAVWGFIGDHIGAIIGYLLGGPIGLMIGAFIDLYNKNEYLREGLRFIWDGIKACIGIAIDGIVFFIDLLTYKIEEVGKAWEALGSGDWGKALEHANNAMTGAGFKASQEIKKKKKEEQMMVDSAINTTKMINETILKNLKIGTTTDLSDKQNVPGLAKLQNKNPQFQSNLDTIETKKQEISQEWLDTWNKFIESQTATIAALTEQWSAFFLSLYNTLAINLALMSILWTLFMLNINLSYINLGIMTNLTIEGMKLKFGELITPLDSFINKLNEANRQISSLRINASFGVILNFISNGFSFKSKENATGTNYFSGGLTTINERGDELILGPTGMVVANNPSTTNIMRDLAVVKGNLSQMNFRMNGNSSENSANNITLNIGNISNRSDIDYMMTQLSMLDLS